MTLTWDWILIVIYRSGKKIWKWARLRFRAGKCKLRQTRFCPFSDFLGRKPGNCGNIYFYVVKNSSSTFSWGAAIWKNSVLTCIFVPRGFPQWCSEWLKQMQKSFEFLCSRSRSTGGWCEVKCKSRTLKQMVELSPAPAPAPTLLIFIGSQI